MSDTSNSSSSSAPEIGEELGGSIWKAFRAHQLKATAWWERFTQQNAEATARDAWRSGHGQPDVSAGLFGQSVDGGEDVINVDSPITHNHPPDSTWKTVLSAGGVAAALMGFWQAPLIIDALTKKPPTVERVETETTNDYEIGEITIE